jgi:hypothetical protein
MQSAPGRPRSRDTQPAVPVLISRRIYYNTAHSPRFISIRFVSRGPLCHNHPMCRQPAVAVPGRRARRLPTRQPPFPRKTKEALCPQIPPTQRDPRRIHVGRELDLCHPGRLGGRDRPPGSGAGRRRWFPWPPGREPRRAGRLVLRLGSPLAQRRSHLHLCPLQPQRRYPRPGRPGRLRPGTLPVYPHRDRPPPLPSPSCSPSRETMAGQDGMEPRLAVYAITLLPSAAVGPTWLAGGGGHAGQRGIPSAPPAIPRHTGRFSVLRFALPAHRRRVPRVGLGSIDAMLVHPDREVRRTASRVTPTPIGGAEPPWATAC